GGRGLGFGRLEGCSAWPTLLLTLLPGLLPTLLPTPCCRPRVADPVLPTPCCRPRVADPVLPTPCCRCRCSKGAVGGLTGSRRAARAGRGRRRRARWHGRGRAAPPLRNRCAGRRVRPGPRRPALSRPPGRGNPSGRVIACERRRRGAVR